MKQLHFLIMIVVLLRLSSSQCHYSCAQCLPSSHHPYTQCYSCNTSQFHVLYTPPLANSKPTGICLGEIPTTPNVVGVLLFVLMVLVCGIIRSKQSIYIFYTLQTTALVGLVESGWIGGTAYLLQSFQYLMIFNVMGRSGRGTGGSTLFAKEYYYRLQTLYSNSLDIASNFKLIGLINLILMLLILAIHLTLYLRKNNQSAQYQPTHSHMVDNPSDNMRIQPTTVTDLMPNTIQPTSSTHWVSDETLGCTMTVLLSIFFLMVQQSMLTLLTSIRFIRSLQRSEQLGIVGFSIGYMIVVVYMMVSVYFQVLPFFCNRISQYINIYRKLILPIFIIIPPSYHYLLFVFMAVFWLVEGCFDLNNSPHFQKCSRWMLYKILQIIVIMFCGIYYAVERTQNDGGKVTMMQGLTTFILITYILLILAEILAGAYEKATEKQMVSVEESIEMKGVSDKIYGENIFEKNETEEALNQLKRYDTIESSKHQKYSRKQPSNNRHYLNDEDSTINIKYHHPKPAQILDIDGNPITQSHHSDDIQLINLENHPIQHQLSHQQHIHQHNQQHKNQQQQLQYKPQHQHKQSHKQSHQQQHQHTQQRKYHQQQHQHNQQLKQQQQHQYKQHKQQQQHQYKQHKQHQQHQQKQHEQQQHQYKQHKYQQNQYKQHEQQQHLYKQHKQSKQQQLQQNIQQENKDTNKTNHYQIQQYSQYQIKPSIRKSQQKQVIKQSKLQIKSRLPNIKLLQEEKIQENHKQQPKQQIKVQPPNKDITIQNYEENYARNINNESNKQQKKRTKDTVDKQLRLRYGIK